MHSPVACDEMETVNCPFCGAAEWTPVVQAEDPDAAPPRPVFGVVRCRACGLCITNPRPTAAAMGKFYAADYSPHEIAQPKHPRQGESKTEPPRRLSRFSQLRTRRVPVDRTKSRARFRLRRRRVLIADARSRLECHGRGFFRSHGRAAPRGTGPERPTRARCRIPIYRPARSIWSRSGIPWNTCINRSRCCAKCIGCSRRAGAFWSPCRISKAFRSAGSGPIGSGWTCPAI